MRAVRGAKGIVHVKIAQLGKRLGEFWIIRLLTGLKPNILEQRDIAVLHVVNDFLRHITNGVVTENDGMMDQGMQIFADWPKRIFLNRLSLGPAEMRHQNGFRAVFAEVIDGRQAFADSGVISDANFAAANFGRHVEVHPHQHAFPADVEIADRKLCHYLLLLLLVFAISQPAFPSTPRSDCCSPTHYHTSRPLLRSDCRSSASACYRRCRSADCQRCPRKRAAHR